MRKDWTKRAPKKPRRKKGNWSGKHQSIRSTQSKEKWNRSIREWKEQDEQPLVTQDRVAPLTLQQIGEGTYEVLHTKQVNQQWRSSNHCEVGQGSYEPMMAQLVFKGIKDCLELQIWAQGHLITQHQYSMMSPHSRFNNKGKHRSTNGGDHPTILK